MKIMIRNYTLVFLAGLLAGVGIKTLIVRHHPMSDRSVSPLTRLLNKLDRKLNLDAGQKASIEKILSDSHQKMSGLKTEVRPKMDSIRNEANTQIRALLNPEQQTKFDELRQKWEDRRKKRRKSWEN